MVSPAKTTYYRIDKSGTAAEITLADGEAFATAINGYLTDQYYVTVSGGNYTLYNIAGEKLYDATPTAMSAAVQIKPDGVLAGTLFLSIVSGTTTYYIAKVK